MKTNQQLFDMVHRHNRATIIQSAIYKHFRVRHLSVDSIPLETLVQAALTHFDACNLYNTPSSDIIATIVAAEID